MKKQLLGVSTFVGLYLMLNLFLKYLPTYYVELIKSFFLSLNLNFISIFIIAFLFQQIFVGIFLFIAMKVSENNIKEKFFNYIINFYKKQFVWLGFINLFKYTIGAYFLYILISGFLLFIINLIGINFPGFFGEQNVANFIGQISINNWYEHLIMFLMIAILVPLIEEIVYRGYIQKMLTEGYGKYIGIFFSAFIFTFIHFEFSVFGNLFILALILAYIYNKTKSLIYTFAFHFLVNGIAFTIIFFSDKILNEIKEGEKLYGIIFF
ncbi:CPBP family intramembrane glutamic endopeptidase [Candidatus Vampirococcus lugosii]|uniref:CAAX protease, self-immunity related n=1 Tax=Candidatus Vampirococcus lugosii TaxID=2789015 RepID=A0ABS5QN65_9BACT|nr:CPBP family intramembrane glutamic endopeptidase [Candidatus Vampirococcus lugosii]MBS8121909.1 CAAX protease, self-immunity related [Candidatus Vampirococcus lugosii]